MNGHYDLKLADFNEDLTNELVAFWLNLINSNQVEGHLFTHSPQAAFGPQATKNLPYPAIKILPTQRPVAPPSLRGDYLTEFFRFQAMATQHNVHLSSEVKIHLEDWGTKMMAYHLYQQKINFEIIFPPYRLPYLAIMPVGDHPFNRLAKDLAAKSNDQIMLAFIPHLFLEEQTNYAYCFYPTSQILNIGSGILEPHLKNYPLLAELRLISYTTWQQNYRQVPGDTTLMVRHGPPEEQGVIPLKNVERFIYLAKNIIQMARNQNRADPKNLKIILKTLQSTINFTRNVSAEISILMAANQNGTRPKFSAAYPLTTPNLSSITMSFPLEITPLEYEFVIPFDAHHPLADDLFFLQKWARQQLQLDHLFLTSTINQLTVLINYLAQGQNVAQERFQRNMLRYAQRYLKSLRHQDPAGPPVSLQQWQHYLHDIIEGP